MTTPKEITATEKLLDLIRASSTQEKSMAVEQTQVAPPSALVMEDLALEEMPVESDITKPVENPPPPAFTSSAPTIDHNSSDISGRASNKEDTEKLLDLIRASSATRGESIAEEGPQVASPPSALTMEDFALEEIGIKSASTKPVENPPPPAFTSSAPTIDHNSSDISGRASNKEDTEKLLDLIRASSSTPGGKFTAEEETPVVHSSPLTMGELPKEDLQGKLPLDVISADSITPQAGITPLQPSLTSSPPTLDDSTSKINGRDIDDDDDEAFPLATERGLDPSTLAKTTARAPSLFHAAASATRRFLQNLRPLTKTTIAIDIQPGMIHLVKTQHSRNGFELLACQSVPYNSVSDSASEHLFVDLPFQEVLFRALSTFMPEHGHHEIWCSYAFCNPVVLHNITIPKVADKDIANAVFWSAKSELEVDEASTLFDYTVLQEISEGDLAKIQTLVTLVPQPEVTGVREMFKNAGFPLTGLTFPAAAIQNFLNLDKSLPTDHPVAFVTIRKNSSFIDVFHHGIMFFSREIKTGADSLIESIVDLASKQNIIIDEEIAKSYLFRPKDNSGTSNNAVDELSIQFKYEELAIIDRLVKQLVRTFEYCGTTFKTPAISKIFTSGEYTVNDDFLRIMENKIGIKCEVIAPLAASIFHRDVPPQTQYGSELVVATGLSLSAREITFNFLYTYKERAQEAATNRINTIIAVITIFLAIICGGWAGWQYKTKLDKETIATSMRVELEKKFLNEPRSRSDDYATQTIQRISQFHSDNQQKIKRFMVIALINELTQHIGPEIKITDLTLDLEQKQDPSRTPKNEPQKPSPGTVQLNGYIHASPDTQQFILMNFLKALATLDMLGEPRLKSNKQESLQNQSVLLFEVTLKTTFDFIEAPSS